MVIIWQAPDSDSDEQEHNELRADQADLKCSEDDDSRGPLVGDRISNTQKLTCQSGKRKAGKTGKGGKGNKNPKITRKLKKSKCNESRVAGSEIPPKVKIVVGIDHGTTHSGASFASNIESTNNSIQTIRTWPEDGNFLLKMPSVIAYAHENQKWGPEGDCLCENVIGHQVKPGMKSYSWFKLLLDEQADPTEFDDPHLRSAVGKGTLILPSGKSAVNVVADFLRLFLDLIKDELARVRGSEAVNDTPINFYITLPAVWDDRAKSKMEKALRSAGFYGRPMDEVNFLSEPEAAAVAAIKQASEEESNTAKESSLAIIADIGGGTTDVEGLQVISSMPLKLAAIGPGLGGKSGSTTADRSLIAWCIEVFGETFKAVPELKRGPGSQFLEAFERAKRGFRGNTKTNYRVPFAALNNQLQSHGIKSKFFDPVDGDLIIPGRIMASLFERILEDTKSLIRQKATEIQKIKGSFPETLILAGGLALSEYVYQEIKKFSQVEYGDKIEVTRPANAWGAISYGAVAYGLELTPVISRVVRRHYLMVQQRAFCEGIDPENRAMIIPGLGKRVDGELQLLLRKGELVTRNMERRHLGKIHIYDVGVKAQRFSWRIYCSNNETPPRYVDDPGCFPIDAVLNIDLEPVYNFWSKKGCFPGVGTDLSMKPPRAKLNIVVGGGHAAGDFYLAARCERKRVGYIGRDELE